MQLICNEFNNNYNNSCLFDILLRLQPFCRQQHLFVRSLTMVIFKLRLFSLHAMHFHTRLTELLLLLWSANGQSAADSWSRTFGASPSRKFYCDYIVVCILCTRCLWLHSHTSTHPFYNTLCRKCIFWVMSSQSFHAISRKLYKIRHWFFHSF